MSNSLALWWLYWCPGLTLRRWQEECRLVEERFSLFRPFGVRGFAFVLNHRHIDGYVHFSDLNHNLVKLAFYVILEAVERLALDSLQPADGSEYLSRNLDPQRFQQIQGQYKRDGDAARSLFNYLNIADILRLASDRRYTNPRNEELK